MRYYYHVLTLLAVAVLATASSAHAQSPFLSNEAQQFANASAIDSLGDDALLIGIASTGDTQNGPGFDPTTGTSSMWIYFYFSPSTRKGLALVTLKIAHDRFIAAGQVINDDENVTSDYAITTDGAFDDDVKQSSLVVVSPSEYREFLESTGGADVMIGGIVACWHY